MFSYEPEEVGRAGVYRIEEYTKGDKSWFDLEVSVGRYPTIGYELVAGRFGSWEQAAEWLLKFKGVTMEGYFA